MVDGGVVDAVARGGGDEGGGGVLEGEDLEEGVDVEGREGAVLSQGGGVVADLEEGDVSFEEGRRGGGGSPSWWGLT